MSEVLVITDLDGSFWGRDLRCHPDTLAAVAELRSREIPVLAATGRRSRSAHGGMVLNGVEFPAVLLNGSLGIDLTSGVQFHTHPFDAGDAHVIVDALASIDLHPVMYVPDGTVRGSGELTTGADHLATLGADLVTAPPAQVIEESAVLSFSMIGMARERFSSLLDVMPDGIAETVLYEDHLYDNAWSVHIQPSGISKWNGIMAYLEYAELDPAKIIAIGDGTNDLEMLSNADLALGVAGGHSEPLALADHIIDHPTTGGWAQVLSFL